MESAYVYTDQPLFSKHSYLMNCNNIVFACTLQHLILGFMSQVHVGARGQNLGHFSSCCILLFFSYGINKKYYGLTFSL